MARRLPDSKGDDRQIDFHDYLGAYMDQPPVDQEAEGRKIERLLLRQIATVLILLIVQVIIFALLIHYTLGFTF
jgi:hypothetical protein